MNLRVGIVGLPNAGKSTLFNALLKRQVAFAANYPFATIEPNIGVVPVPDSRLERLTQIVEQDEHMMKPPPIVPATVEFVDIAGLVKGASEGQGLGNKFLSHIREVNVIAHVIRSFQDPDIIHVNGTPIVHEDKETIETELILADLQTLEKQTEPRGVADKKEKARWEVIQYLKDGLNRGALAREWVVDPQKQQRIADLHLLTMKPMVYVLNVGENDLNEEALTFERREELVDERESFKPDASVVLASAKIEAELAGLPEDEQREYLASLGLKESGLERLIQKAYAMLGLISFLTMGEKEVRAWTIHAGDTAIAASGEIHTDFMQKFIKAEVISFSDLDRIGSRTNARELGKLRLEGREYVMQDGDIVEFKIGS
ncbi:MAG: redox-regulated ATPase YchF [bacterium]|nr:redox-regulated ATPase YchF [bacterium]